MDIKKMTIDDIETRSMEITNLLKGDAITADEAEKEIEQLESRKAEILAEIERRKQQIDEVIKSDTITEFEEEEKRNMDVKELRNSKEYIDAFAEYLKGNDKEMRALLSTNTDEGTVAVPAIVADRIERTWEKSRILSRVRKVFVKGDYFVQYEDSASGATIHVEGTNAPAEEALVLGTVRLIPNFVKKWIKVSDVVMTLRGQAFIDYLFDEFENQMVKAIETAIIMAILNSTLSEKVTHALDGDAVLAGMAALGEETADLVVIGDRATYAAIKGIRTMTGNRIEDPFEGLEYIPFTLPALNQTLLVGDLDAVIANFPDGEEYKFIIDEKTYAEFDLVKIVGKIMMAVDLVRPGAFAVINAGGGAAS